MRKTAFILTGPAIWHGTTSLELRIGTPSLERRTGTSSLERGVTSWMEAYFSRLQHKGGGCDNPGVYYNTASLVQQREVYQDIKTMKTSNVYTKRKRY
jgi:hypothetical protein